MKELEIILAVQRIGRLSDEEKTSEIGLREQIKGIKRLMMDIRSCARNISRSRHNQVDHEITQIYEIACQIEAIIDAQSHRKKYSTKSRFSSYLSINRLDDPSSRIKSEINKLCNKLKQHDQTIKNMRATNPEVMDNYEEESGNDHRDEWTRFNSGANVVGLNLVKHQLIQRLLGNTDTLRVITLCGLGGVGKRTLAEEVYNHPQVEHEFFFRIWIRVSSKLKTKKILLYMLTQLGVKHIDASKLDIAELAEQVIDGLRKRERYLIVLDDVWSTQDLDELYRFFPDNHKGSTILFTTRNRRVAEYGNPKPIVYTVSPLTEADAWELFMKTIQRQRGPDFKLEAYKEKTGKEMVKHCEGLPVAIIKLGQELAVNLDTWNGVHRVISKFIYESVLQKVFAPNFDDLSDHLKLCFLYLGIWPEGFTIDVEKLYHFWIAEGLVNQQEVRVGETLLNVAERYLTELEGRCMVEVDEGEFPRITRLASCRVHRMMRQLSISKGNQIDFAHIVDFRGDPDPTSLSSINKPQSLFVYLEGPEDLSSILDNNKKPSTEHLRILQFLDSYKQQDREPVRLSGNKFEYKELMLLRLLDFDGVDFRQNDVPAKGGRLLEEITNLVNLRYLSFKGCFLDQLPLTTSNLLYLQILDLRVAESVAEVTLPNVLWKLKKMKHLYLPRMFRSSNGEKLRLDGLTELETLDNFITSVCNVTDLHTLTKLHNVAVRIDGSLSDLKYIAEYMNKQIQLYIDVRNFDCYVEKRHSLLREVLQSQAVRIFCIEGHIRELPPSYKISPSLMKIVLSGSELEKNPLETLATLPNLCVLVLSNNAFIGTDMIAPPSGFPELNHLELVNLEFLEKWTVTRNSMPKLSKTKVENCKKLVKLDGFEFLTAVKELETGEMSKSFEDWLHHTYRRAQKDVKITSSVIHGEPSYIPEPALDLAIQG